MSVDFAFLDSGTGGIPYMIDLKKKMPEARCLYLGDTEHFPYGEKSVSQIIECSGSAIERIISRWQPKTIIIACNTISVAALDSLRTRFPQVPIVGTVPAVKLAAKFSKNRRIGFLATNAAVNHPYSKKLIEDFASDCTVISRGDPDLIAFIEHDFFIASEAERLEAVKPAVDFFIRNDCDTIILGCTHFTHVASYVQKAAGEGIKVVDSRDGVSNQAIRVELGSCVPVVQDAGTGSEIPDMSFFVTAADDEQEKEYRTLCKNCNIPWGGIL